MFKKYTALQTNTPKQLNSNGHTLGFRALTLTLSQHNQWQIGTCER